MDEIILEIGNVMGHARNEYLVERAYEIESLLSHHKEMLRLELLGYKPKDIAQLIGLSEDQVSKVRNSAIYVEQLNILELARDTDSLAVARRIAEMAPVAVHRINEVIGRSLFDPANKEDHSLVVRASQDILDRAGHGAINRSEVIHHTKEDLDRLKADAIKAGIEDGVIIKEETVEDAIIAKGNNNDKG